MIAIFIGHLFELRTLVIELHIFSI